MSSLAARITARLRQLSFTQLRFIYSVIGLLALLWVSLVTLTHYLSLSSHTDECSWTIEERLGTPMIVVDSLFPGGAAEQAGVRVGDAVMAINGTVVGTAGDRFLMNHAQTALDMAPTGVPIEYIVLRNGEAEALSIVLKDPETPLAQDLLRFVLPTVTFIWLLVGVMVILSQPQGTVQRRFFLTAAASVFALTPGGFFQSNALWLGISENTARLFDATQLLLGGFFFVFWLRFCASFPVDRPLFSTRWRRLLLWLPVGFVFAALIVEIALPGQSLNQVVNNEWRVLVMVLNGVLFMIWIAAFLTGIGLLFGGYRRLPPGSDRRPMRIILAGAILTTLTPVYILLMVTFAESVEAPVSLGQWLLVPVLLLPTALPLSFGYSIFKYQVMDFRRVISTTAVYVVTMMLIVALYLGLGYAVAQLFGALPGRLGETLQIVGFVLFLLLFDPLKRQLQTMIEQRFFPQRRDYSSNLVAFSDRASQVVRTEDVGHLIADVLSRTLDLSDVCVVLWESPRQPTVAARVCHAAEAPPVDAEMLESLHRHLRREHTLLALETLGDPALDSLRACYHYAVGLATRESIHGAVLIGEPNDGSMLNSRQVQFIGAIATQGSAALEIARLLEKEIARQRYLEELATARRIQQNILPVSLPEFPGVAVSAVSNPAQTVGGDYFNVIQLDDEHVLVIVADVSGKGLPASFYMAELHGMVCIASTTCATPSQMLATINDHLYREMPRGTFITATALLFDTERRRLSLARAGHTPLIYRNHAGTVTVTPPGPALGFVRGHRFLSMLSEARIDYLPGDTFILYSDGISEMMNGGKEEFGDERLRALVGSLEESDAEAIRDRIVRTVDGFRDGAEQHDDMTVVVVQAARGDRSECIAPVEQRTSA